jgi:tetratricopeptide (TPR) repeat protein
MAYALLGDVYQDARDFFSARHAYLIAAQLDQQLLWPRLGLAAAFQRDLNYTAAGKTYLATEQDFPDESQRCRILSASLLVSGQDYEGAARIYEAIPDQARLAPPLLRRLMLAGRAYSLEKLDRREEAEYFWSRMVEEFPDDFDGAMRDRELASQAFEALARYHEQKGDARRARKLLEQATRHAGMAFPLYTNLAGRQVATGAYESAVDLLRRGLSGAPEEADLLDLTQAALPVLRSLAAQAPSPVRKEAAEFVAELGRRLAKSSPESHVPYLNLARAESLIGDRSRALEYLEAAVRRGFQGMSQASTDPDFKAISGEPGFRTLSGV